MNYDEVRLECIISSVHACLRVENIGCLRRQYNMFQTMCYIFVQGIEVKCMFLLK